MINLLPIEEKKEAKKDFYYRFTVLSFVMLIFLIVISIIAILPSYFISLEKKISINQKLEVQKNEIMPEIDQKAQVIIKNLDEKLSLLEKARKNKYIFSQNVVNEIILKKGSGIKINRIFFENDSLEGRKVNINGVAQDREKLLLFRRALEDDILFKYVDLPISNFVKGSNIEFNLNLISI